MGSGRRFTILKVNSGISSRVRLREGYHIAHSSGGVVNLVAEMEMMVAKVRKVHVLEEHSQKL
jgi:hypothetical protein